LSRNFYQEARKLAAENRKTLDAKRREFKNNRKRMFDELVFCLLTPQSSMLKCKHAVCQLKNKGLLQKGNKKGMAAALKGKTRFHNNKARYVALARVKFDGRALLKIRGTGQKREWLVKNIEGLDQKEASHFLRNIGFFDVAIIDRHVKSVIKKYGLAKPAKTLTKKEYERLEKVIGQAAAKTGLETGIFDLLLFAMDAETGAKRRAELLKALK